MNDTNTNTNTVAKGLRAKSSAQSSHKLRLLRCLQDGTFFRIPGLEEVKKNMRLLGVNESAARVSGLERDSKFDSEWRSFEYRISSTTQVYVVGDGSQSDKGDKGVNSWEFQEDGEGEDEDGENTEGRGAKGKGTEGAGFEKNRWGMRQVTKNKDKDNRQSLSANTNNNKNNNGDNGDKSDQKDEGSAQISEEVPKTKEPKSRGFEGAPKISATRGRPPLNISIVFPEIGEEFNINTVAALNPEVAGHNIRNYLVKLIKLGSVIETRTQSGGRGRPVKFMRRVS